VRKIVIYLVPLAAFLVLASFLLRGLWLHPAEIPSPLIGKPAPAFQRPQLLTDRAFASSDMTGKVWLLNVFASWCAPCREEHVVWNELARQKVVTVVGLNYKDQPDTARKWLAELGDPYQAIATDGDGRVGLDFGVYGVPETFVIDKLGIIRYKHIGPVTADALASKILPLVRQLSQ
jgi:cytochrome c biogenesis protein CcmG/thiol:disulfide interchange protein DsbE